MRIAATSNEAVIAVTDDDASRVEGGGRDLTTLLRDGVDIANLRQDAVENTGGLHDSLTAPLRPGKIVAIGLNYRDHAEEAGLTAPERPLVFAKFPSSVIGPRDSIVIDSALTSQVDWEAELAVVVGKSMRRVSVDDALQYVFGYTVANDVSARDVQRGDGQWVRGKSLDTFCPLGPWIVTADEVGDPQDMAISARVNDEVVQSGNTRSMIFSVAEILAFCSYNLTLEPGDVVLTGTPAGVGMAHKPPKWLAPGDVLFTEIEGLGSLCNPVVPNSVESASAPSEVQTDH